MKKNLKLQLQKDSIVIKVDSLNEELKNIKSFIQKNFKYFKNDIDSIVLEPNLLAESFENSKRLKLVRWCVKKSDILDKEPSLAKNILNSYQQKIHIDIEYYKLSQDIVSIKVFKFDDEVLVFELISDFLPMISNIIMSFLKKQFLDSNIIQFDKVKKRLFVKIDNFDSKKALYQLINRKFLVGKSVTFIYDEKLIKEVLKDYDENQYKYKIPSAKEYIHKLRKSYQTLEVQRGEKDFDLIKKQYLKFAKEYHPDKFHNEDKEKLEFYNKKFLELKDAYEVLKNHFSRN